MFKLKEELLIVLMLVALAAGAMGCRSRNTDSSFPPNYRVSPGSSHYVGQPVPLDAPPSSDGGSCPSCQ